MCYDASELEKIFNLESLDCIYLNFSDPWPKARHAKRRLTYKTFLDKYYSLLKKGGKIIMKTDNLGLFEYSLESIKEHNKFKLVEYTFDYEFDGSKDGMSEYERKFREIGTKINRLVCIKE
jgi:tRNA (guanine-N7-)-methyltransferase